MAKEDDGATDDNIEYYYLRITDPDPPHSQVLVYLDTSEQKMLYDPITFQTDYKSNYSGNNTIDSSLYYSKLLKLTWIFKNH